MQGRGPRVPLQGTRLAGRSTRPSRSAKQRPWSRADTDGERSRRSSLQSGLPPTHSVANDPPVWGKVSCPGSPCAGVGRSAPTRLPCRQRRPERSPHNRPGATTVDQTPKMREKRTISPPEVPRVAGPLPATVKHWCGPLTCFLRPLDDPEPAAFLQPQNTRGSARGHAVDSRGPGRFPSLRRHQGNGRC